MSSLLGWEGSVGLGGLLGDGRQVGTLRDLVPVKVRVDGVVGNNDGGSDVDVMVVVNDGHMGCRDLDGGGHHSRHVDVVVRGSGNHNSGRSHNSGALVGSDGGGSTGLVGPGVGGEPGGWGEVLAGGAVAGINVAPSGTGGVDGPAVALDVAGRVNEGEAGALASAVGEGGGCLQVAAHLLQGGAGGKGQGGKEDLQWKVG